MQERQAQFASPVLLQERTRALSIASVRRPLYRDPAKSTAWGKLSEDICWESKVAASLR